MVKSASKPATDHLHMVQQKLKAERAKGKQLLGDSQQKDAEYCELEESFKEAAADVDAFLEGTKKYRSA